MLLPDNNLPTLIGISSESDNAISRVFTGLSLEESLAELSPYFTTKIWFSEPVRIYRKKKEVHVFRSFFISRNGYLCYSNRNHPKTGRIFSEKNLITKLEFISENISCQFKSYKEFCKKFDTRFIIEKEIRKLWNSKSSQHSGQYNKHDFKRLGKKGKRVMERFLNNFIDVTTINKVYPYHKSNLYDNEEVWVYKEKQNSDSLRLGRDISISHQSNCPYVFYSSEYPGCLNGRYGLIANKNEYLWLEDD